jgi:hypothetical protein
MKELNLSQISVALGITVRLPFSINQFLITLTNLPGSFELLKDPIKLSGTCKALYRVQVHGLSVHTAEYLSGGCHLPASFFSEPTDIDIQLTDVLAGEMLNLQINQNMALQYTVI